MTLDEAIKDCEEVASANERLCETIQPAMRLSDYDKRATVHRQLAEWLEELKQLREQTSWIPMIRREPTDEEKAEYLARNGEELCYMLENEMPLNGQEVLVSSGEYVSEDVFYEEFYDFENHEVVDVDAWMPLPKAYKAEK